MIFAPIVLGPYIVMHADCAGVAAAAGADDPPEIENSFHTVFLYSKFDKATGGIVAVSAICVVNGR